MNPDEASEESVGEMFRRDTKMPDGRYLIYYTFGGESENAGQADTAPGTTEEENV